MPLGIGCGELSRALVFVIALTAHLLLGASLCLGGPTLVRWQTPFADQSAYSGESAEHQDTIPFEEQTLALPTIRVTRDQEQGPAADYSAAASAWREAARAMHRAPNGSTGVRSVASACQGHCRASVTECRFARDAVSMGATCRWCGARSAASDRYAGSRPGVRCVSRRGFGVLAVGALRRARLVGRAA